MILSWFYDPRILMSGWTFAQFLRLIRVLAVRMKKPYVLTYPSRNFAEFVREMSRSLSAKCCGVTSRTSRSFSAKFSSENPQRNKLVLFFFAKNIISRKGYSAAKREKRDFFLGLICTFTVYRQPVGIIHSGTRYRQPS